MIQVTQQPAAWSSAYDDNIFSFYASRYIGEYTILSASGYANIVADAGTIGEFAIGDYLTVYIGAGVEKVKVTDIVGFSVVTDRAYVGAFITSSVGKVFTELLDMKMMVCRPSLGEPLTDVAVFSVISREGVYSVNVSGYLQDLFLNMPPPVIGNDRSLYTQYQLQVFIGAWFDIGTLKSCAYSTVEDLNSTNYVVTSEPLRVGDIEIFNSSQSVYSHIIGNRINTHLI